MPRGDGSEGTKDTKARASDEAESEDSRAAEIRFVIDSDYIKALDKSDPGFAERILALMEERQRFEEKRTQRLISLRFLTLVALALAIAVVIGIGVYLLAHDQSGPAQIFIIVANVAALFFTWIFSRKEGMAEHRISRSKDSLDD
jgi:hypothetical protein